MSQVYKNSFAVIIGLVFLLPLFFVPAGVMDVLNAKSALLVIGTVVATLIFAFEAWRAKSVGLAKHPFVYAVLLLPVVYLLSALLSTPSSLSLLGYNFESGTFGFILVGTILFALVSAVFTDASRALQALLALFASMSLVALFAGLRVLFGGDFLSLGVFSGSMGNPLGSWTDLAIAFGLLSLISALALGMLPVKALVRTLLYLVFALSTLLLVIINFSTAFWLTLAASIILFFYFGRVESHFLSKGNQGIGGAKLLPVILGVISLVMIINPSISDTRGNLGNVIAEATGVVNSDVRPTLGATLSVSKAVLSQTGLLGSGPNTFGQDWLIFKPVDVNATPFWGVIFPFGVGFIPTQIATTGILGSALWLAFFVLLFALAIKVVSNIPESRAGRFTLVSALFVSLFIWVSALLYTPSETIMILGFVFTGLLVALSVSGNILSSRTLNMESSAQARTSSVVLIALIVLGAGFLGWLGGTKAISAYHFNRAITLSNTPNTPLDAIEAELMKAIELAPADVHYVAISRLNFSKAQVVANSATGTPEQNRAVFEQALSRSIAAARAAVATNPAGYQNWVILGQIYAALVPEPLQVEGAYENAAFAYNEALKRNPNNPQLPLYLAQLELNKGNVDAARSYIRNSIALKQDYADAYLALAQLEVSQNNIPAAIESTEALAVLAPDNAGIHFELGVLKYSGQDFAGAEASLRRALELSPDYANAKYYLALTHQQLGRDEEARALLEELLVSNPDSAELKAALEELED